MASQRRGALGRQFFWAALAAACAVGVMIGLRGLERRVLSGQTVPAPAAIRVALVDRPAWIPLSLGQQIAASLTPPDAAYYDPELAQTVYSLAEKNPWIARVHSAVKRRMDDPALGLVEVKADYRWPVARVACDRQYYFVDRQGVRLPDDVPFWVKTVSNTEDTEKIYYLDGDLPPARTAGERQRLGIEEINYIVLDGVKAPPPPVGGRWAGEDIQDGLRLVMMVQSKDYAREIVTVDVRNHGYSASRADPQIRMTARVREGRATDIRFGRFPIPGGGDYEISPERKISYLDSYWADHGRLAGLHSYLDLRYDDLRVSLN